MTFIPTLHDKKVHEMANKPTKDQVKDLARAAKIMINNPEKTFSDATKDVKSRKEKIREMEKKK